MQGRNYSPVARGSPLLQNFFHEFNQTLRWTHHVVRLSVMFHEFTIRSRTETRYSSVSDQLRRLLLWQPPLQVHPLPLPQRLPSAAVFAWPFVRPSGLHLVATLRLQAFVLPCASRRVRLHHLQPTVKQVCRTNTRLPTRKRSKCDCCVLWRSKRASAKCHACSIFGAMSALLLFVKRICCPALSTAVVDSLSSGPNGTNF